MGGGGKRNRRISLTVRVGRQVYDRMHAITEAERQKHNGFVERAIEEKIEREERLRVERDRMVGE